MKRVGFDAPSGHRLSALMWGSKPPELVLLHGGAQNAHTWDTVALALGRSLLAIDLPGHGHSDWRRDRDYRPQQMASDVGAMIVDLAGEVEAIVGMSLGGLTATAIAHEHHERIRRLALVDITPGVNRDKARSILDFVSGPEEFGSFEEILERTVQFNPARSVSSLRRGILHNARRRPDGKWVWRYDLPLGPDHEPRDHGLKALWDALEHLPRPLALFQGASSGVVGEEDISELRRRRPDLHHVVVEGAGHSIQGDRPVELPNLIEAFLQSTDA